MLPTKQRRKFKEESGERRKNLTKIKDKFLMGSTSMTGHPDLNCQVCYQSVFLKPQSELHSCTTRLQLYY